MYTKSSASDQSNKLCGSGHSVHLATQQGHPASHLMQGGQNMVDIENKNELMEYLPDQEAHLLKNRSFLAELDVASHSLQAQQVVMQEANSALLNHPTTIAPRPSTRTNSSPCFENLPGGLFVNPSTGRGYHNPKTDLPVDLNFPRSQGGCITPSWYKLQPELDKYRDTITAARNYGLKLDIMLADRELSPLLARQQIQEIKNQTEKLEQFPRSVVKLEVAVIGRQLISNLLSNLGEIEKRFPKVESLKLPLSPFSRQNGASTRPGIASLKLPLSPFSRQNDESTRPGIAMNTHVLSQQNPFSHENECHRVAVNQPPIIDDEEFDMRVSQRMEEILEEREEARQREIQIEQTALETARDILDLDIAEKKIRTMKDKQEERKQIIEDKFGIDFDEFLNLHIRPAMKQEKARRATIRLAQNTPRSVLLAVPSASQKCLFCGGKHFAFLCYSFRANTLRARHKFYKRKQLCVRCGEKHEEGTACPRLFPKHCKWFNCLGEDHHSNLCPIANYPITKGKGKRWRKILKERKEIMKSINWRKN